MPQYILAHFGLWQLKCVWITFKGSLLISPIWLKHLSAEGERKGGRGNPTDSLVSIQHLAGGATVSWSNQGFRNLSTSCDASHLFVWRSHSLFQSEVFKVTAIPKYFCTIIFLDSHYIGLFKSHAGSMP